MEMGVVTDAWPFVWASYAIATIGVTALIGFVWSNLRYQKRRLDQLSDEDDTATSL